MRKRGLHGTDVIIVGLVYVVVWLTSGMYVVNPDEQGVVLRFGALAQRTAPGLHYHLAWPIESVDTPKVTRENQVNIGYRPDNAGRTRDVPQGRNSWRTSFARRISAGEVGAAA